MKQINKPEGLYLEDHVSWNKLPTSVKVFLTQTEKAEKAHAKDFKNFPFDNEEKMRKHPQMQLTEQFNTFMAWYIHESTMEEKRTFWESILYDTMARGSIKQFLVNDHNTRIE